MAERGPRYTGGRHCDREHAKQLRMKHEGNCGHMSRVLISRSVLTELREYFVRQHVLRTIADVFEDQGIKANPQGALQISGDRRQLVEEYYAGLDLTCPADAQKLLRVIEREIARSQPRRDELAQAPIGSVIICLEQNGYRVDGYSILPGPATPLASLQGHLERINSQSVLDDWQRMLTAVDTDPEDAITAARALVESVCKSVLDDLQLAYEDKWDLGRLYKEAAGALQLSPGGFHEQVFKQILSGMFSAAAGLAEVRNALGDAHGKGKRPVRALPRHARLAVNAAGTLAVFLLETLEARRG